MKHTMYFDHDNGTKFTEQWQTSEIKQYINSMIREAGGKPAQYTISIKPSEKKTSNKIVVKFTKTQRTANCWLGFAWGRYVCEPDNINDFV